MNKIIPMLVIIMPFFAKGEEIEIKTCNLSDLDTKVEGVYDVSRGLGTYDNCKYHSSERDLTDCSHSYFKDLKSGEWAVSFKHGKLKGVAKCSSTDGIYAVAGDPDVRVNREKHWEKQYCWCQPTIYEHKDGTKCLVTPSSWFFLEDYDDSDLCNFLCAEQCAWHTHLYVDFRPAIFGQLKKGEKMQALLCIAISGILFVVSYIKINGFTLPEQQLGYCLCITASIFLCTGFLLNFLEETLKKQNKKREK